MRPIFICYRREDAEGEAGRLFDDLSSRFGEGSVFLDVAAIEAGRDFRKAIDESVSSCGVLLAIIGRHWVGARDEAGSRRLEEPSDFVRLEIATALKREIPVVPVLVQGVKMPRPEELPNDLKDLAYRNGVELTHARWRSDLELLIKALGSAAAPRSSLWRRSRWGISALLVAALVVGLGAYLLRSKPIIPNSNDNHSPATITVPLLTGKPLSIAQVELQDLHLVVGNISWQPSADFGQDVVLNEFPKAGREVASGTPIDLMLSEATGKSQASPPAQPQQSNVEQSFPNFAGTWQMFENTYNGVSNQVNAERPLVITQNGPIVHIGRDLHITDSGTVTYQSYAVHDDKYGHDVATADQADLVDTFTWRLDGSILVFETIFDYKHQYYSHPPGKDVRIMKYRRVAE